MKNNYLTTNFVLNVAFLLLFSFSTSAQNDYAVLPIPFQVYTATVPVQGTLDDTFSAPISLGFDFYFYGAIYNLVNVSTNGYIIFSPQTQGTYSPWA